MSLIYEPSGKAREYSPLALNVYKNCDHQCKYCYVRNFQPNFSEFVQPRILSGLDNEASKASRQILLCFTGDPYCSANDAYQNTRKALEILKKNHCTVAILSKGGTRCLQDLDLFVSWPDRRFKVGATLTFVSPEKSMTVEPGAALPADRLDALEKLHAAGVHTWASIEPVMEAEESIAIIRASLSCVDEYKVGKLNHQKSTTDWRKFCIDAVSVLHKAGKRFYVKFDLAAFAPSGFLTPEETDPETVFLPNRPSSLFQSRSVEEQIMFPGM